MPVVYVYNRGANGVNHARHPVQGIVLEADARAGGVVDVREVADRVVGVIRSALSGAPPADEPPGFVKC